VSLRHCESGTAFQEVTAHIRRPRISQLLDLDDSYCESFQDAHRHAVMTEIETIDSDSETARPPDGTVAGT